MCGIFATTRPELWASLLDPLRVAMHRRGPDGHRTWADDQVMVAHSRLAAGDSGPYDAQPLVDETGAALTFDGEVRDGDDSPAFVPGLGRLRGMFAVAHWDPRTRVLTAARDPWGVKPLYVLDHSTGGVTVSSELGPLLLLGEARVADPIGVATYLAFGHTGPLITSYRAIRKVRPGVAYQWTVGAGGTTQFRTERFDQVPPSEPSTVTDAVRASVIAQLPAAASFGVLMPGDVASLLLTAIARERDPATRAFTIGFPEVTGGDGRLALANGRILGVRHEVVDVRASDMVAALDDLLSSTGEPCADISALAECVLVRRLAKDVDVLMTAHGATAMFGDPCRERLDDWLPRRPIPLVAQWGSAVADRGAARRGDGTRSRTREAFLRAGGARSHAALLGADIAALEAATPYGRAVANGLHTDWEALIGDARGCEAACRFDLGRWLPNTRLEWSDRAMSGVVEGRVPFLDVRVDAAVHASGRKVGASTLAAELGRLAPGVRLPGRGASGDLQVSRLLDAGLRPELDRVLQSEDSVLRRLYGADFVTAIAQRCVASPTMVRRLAVLGRWESVTDVLAD